MNGLLEKIKDPSDLRRLREDQLPQLAKEVRDLILGSVSRTGGHLSSNLGTVELAIALHYVFDTPRDRLVWDVGHQTYAHKILTGRREGMAKLRQWGGIAGFPRRVESEYDTFGTAHSSTSISAALGMAIAARRKGEKRAVVAVIGDGAMSAGMAFEAMNNAGAAGADLLVILNDNDMSISEPVGAFNNYLARLLSGRVYNTMRRGGKEVLSKLPPVKELARRWEEHMKGMVLPGTLFEEFGFNYIGPIDGHDLDTLVKTLSNVRKLSGPQLLHVMTRKGHGYAKAEEDPILYHGVTKFDPAVGIVPKPPGKPSYTQVFGDWLCDMAARDVRLIGITPAMREGSGLVRFSQEYPDRYFDVGIAEQHALTFAAGLACEGMKPVVAIYSTFLQRAYDQLIHDVVLQNLPVVFAIDRGGLVGADGPAILAFGSMLHPSLAAAEEIDATVANMRFVKPLDVELVIYLARTHEALVTVEENVVAGGAGSAVSEALAAKKFAVPVLHLGLPDEFIDHGDPAVLLAHCGLDAKGIAASINERFGSRKSDSQAPPVVVNLAKPAA